MIDPDQDVPGAGGDGEQFNPAEFMAGLRAAEDQAAMGVAALAERLGTYRIQLLIAGFAPEEMFELVSAYHGWLLDAMTQTGTPDE